MQPTVTGFCWGCSQRAPTVRSHHHAYSGIQGLECRNIRSNLDRCIVHKPRLLLSGSSPSLRHCLVVDVAIVVITLYDQLEQQAVSRGALLMKLALHAARCTVLAAAGLRIQIGSHTPYCPGFNIQKASTVIARILTDQSLLIRCLQRMSIVRERGFARHAAQPKSFGHAAHGLTGNECKSAFVCDKDPRYLRYVSVSTRRTNAVACSFLTG